MLTFAKDDFIRNYIASLDLLLASATPIAPALRLLKLEELLLYLFQTSAASISAFQPSSHAELKLRNVAEAHIAQPVTVEELAFLCHMSVSTFQRKFAAVYGTTPQKWLLHQKMQLAARLLQRPHEQPSDVYQQVGYENHSSFSEAFRKTFGLSPTAFKQQKLAPTDAADRVAADAD